MGWEGSRWRWRWWWCKHCFISSGHTDMQKIESISETQSHTLANARNVPVHTHNVRLCGWKLVGACTYVHAYIRTYVRTCTCTYTYVNGGICIGKACFKSCVILDDMETGRAGSGRAVANRSCCMLYTPRVVHSQGLSPGSSRTAKGIRHT